MTHVLVMGAGSGPAISIIKLLREQNELPIRLFGSDMDIMAAGLYLCDNYFLTPAASSKHFVENIEAKCTKFGIKFIFCPLDVENLVLSKYKNRLKKSGITLLCDKWEKLSLASDKALANMVCNSHHIPTPKTYENEFPEVIDRKYIYKPIIGCGAKNNVIINTEMDKSKLVHLWLTQKQPFLCQEYIEGTEYSIDILSDQHGQPLYCVPRERIAVRDGQMVKGRTVIDPQLIMYAKNVAKIFGISGVGCLQCIKNTEGIYFIEYNPRYGTGVNLSGMAGINMPLLHLKMALGMKIDMHLKYKEISMSRYWREVFIEEK